MCRIAHTSVCVFDFSTVVSLNTVLGGTRACAFKVQQLALIKKINKIRTKNHGDRCVMVVVVVVFRDRYPDVKFIETGRRGSITMSLSSHQPITGGEYRTGYVKTLIKTKELISDLEKMEFLSIVLTNPNLKFYKTPPMPADGKGRRYDVVLEKTNRRK